MSEREKIVAFLRRMEAQWSEENRTLPRHKRAHDVAGGGMLALHLAADRIEAGEHLKRPEPTIPASEWVPKSNLTHG